MAELAFLDAVSTFLATQVLSPAVPAARIGAIAPFTTGDLPAVVLSLDTTERRRIGLGDRSDVMTGALGLSATIDLANPVLPEEPTFRLLDPTNRVLTLPHGGLVRADGTEGPLGSADLSVTVNGTPRAVVGGVPNATQVQPDAAVGQLTFGAALPAAGAVLAQYFVGQWERRVERIAGVLRVEACAATAVAAASLAATTIAPLLSPVASDSVRQLMQIGLTSVSAVVHHPEPSGNAPVPVAHFRRTATLAFEFQHLIDRADSSGGVIRRVPITTRLSVEAVDRATGALLQHTVDVV